MRTILLAAVLAASAASGGTPAGGRDASAPVRPEEAWRRMEDGNRRFVSDRARLPSRSAARRRATANAQHPIAAVLSCADSRVPPEIVFDQGLGDLFTVRVAGHDADPQVEGSLEYAVEHLGVRLIVVLGHERCGAVSAATQSADAPGHVGDIVRAIRPAVDRAWGKPGDLVENAVVANVERVVENLRANEVLRAEGVEIVGARYDLDSGEVTRVGEAR